MCIPCIQAKLRCRNSKLSDYSLPIKLHCIPLRPTFLTDSIPTSPFFKEGLKANHFMNGLFAVA